METYIKSRCYQLAPLSEEHQEGMLFIKRIRAGIKNISGNRLRSYITWYWKNHIRPHFFQEERVLLPYIPAWNFLGQRLQEEHDEIRELVIAIDYDPQKQSMESFCNLIESHIRFEEEQVYSYLERQLGKNKLDVIYAELTCCPNETEPWGDEFWK